MKKISASECEKIIKTVTQKKMKLMQCHAMQSSEYLYVPQVIFFDYFGTELHTTSFSMSFSIISTVLNFRSPETSSKYSSVLTVTVSPSTRSDSFILIGPGDWRNNSFGKSSLDGRNN